MAIDVAPCSINLADMQHVVAAYSTGLPGLGNGLLPSFCTAIETEKLYNASNL